jgi:uncharacterized membrane protein
MVGMAIIITIIFSIILSNQNKRIDTLEKYLQNSSKITAAPTISTVSPNTPYVSTPHIESNISTSNINATQSVKKTEYKEESSGEILGKIGIGALVLGVSFFLKYAFDNNWIGPTGRVFIGILVGGILIALGQYLRKKYDVFSEIMFGGGIAILYLSFYAAHSFYNIIDSFSTGIFMVLVTVLTFTFSFINKDNKLAILAVTGGFLTPYIIGASGNNMTEIFSYLVILNIGVLAITIFKKWPELVAVAIIGTAINFFTWFSSHYTESVLGSTVFFLIISFIIFFIASVYRIIILKVKSTEVDYFLLLANAFGFYGTFYSIVKPMHESMLGFYTLIIAIFYIIVAYLSNKNNNEDRALNIFLPGMAVAFLSIVVPIQFSGAYIAILWFVEACVLYLIALSISNRGFQIMGICVYALGILNFIGWNTKDVISFDFVPFMNKAFGILVVAIISAYTIAYIYNKYGSISEEIKKNGTIIFIVVANIISIYALSTQIIFYFNSQNLIIENNFSTRSEMVSYNGGSYNNYGGGLDRSNLETARTSNKNKSNTSLSILWAVYAAILTAVGFAKRSSSLRIFGLSLFILTAVKIFIDVWSLGPLYRIISFIGLGIIALVASFVYVKYKDRLKME